MKQNRIILFALLILYCLIRIPQVLSYSDTISYELYRGTIALEWMEGLKLPLGDYLTDFYSWAPVFNGLLTAPFFLLFGENLFALKLVPFFWHFFSLITWFYVWRLYFSPKETFLILILFVLAPPRIVEYMLSNHGTHFETILWTALSILILNRIVQKEGRVFQGGLLLGLIGGFSSSLIPTNLVTVVVILISAVLAKAEKRFFLAYALTFLVGFCPWLVFNVQHDWSGLEWPKQLFIYHITFEQLAQNLWDLFFKWNQGLRGLFRFDIFHKPFGTITTISYLILYPLCLIVACIRKRMDRFSLLFQLLFLGIVLVAQYGWVEYYLFPLVPFIGMTIISAVQNAHPLLKNGVVGFCILSGLMGNLLLVNWSGMGRNLFIQGYSFGELANVMEHRFGQDITLFQEKERRLFENRSSVFRKAFYQNLPPDIFAISEEKGIDKILLYIKAAPEEFQPVLFEKLGVQLGLIFDFDPDRLNHDLKEYQIPASFYPFIYRGAVSGLNQVNLPMSERIQKGLAFCSRITLDAKVSCYEGIGALVEPGYVSSKISNHFVFVNQIPEVYRQPYFWGVGRYFASIWVHEGDVAENFMASLKPEEQSWFKEGIKKEISFMEDPWIRNELIKNLSSF